MQNIIEQAVTDGRKWAARAKTVSPLAASRAAGNAAMRKVVAGKLTATDMVTYCTPFIEAALGAR